MYTRDKTPEYALLLTLVRLRKRFGVEVNQIQSVKKLALSYQLTQTSFLSLAARI
jgi:hypothetical protein